MGIILKKEKHLLNLIYFNSYTTIKILKIIFVEKAGLGSQFLNIFLIHLKRN